MDCEPDDIQVVLPEGSLYPNSAIAADLCALTHILVEANGAPKVGGALGGEWGYGTRFENDVFRMSNFCWCEADDCPQCVGCSCPEEAFHYFVDGVEVDYEEWIGIYDREVGEWRPGMPEEEMQEMERKGREVNERRDERHDPVCDFCLTGGPAAAAGGGPGRSAPNFWHKPSGIKIWFYKYIGRSMEFEGPIERWEEAYGEVVGSLPATL